MLISQHLVLCNLEKAESLLSEFTSEELINICVEEPLLLTNSTDRLTSFGQVCVYRQIVIFIILLWCKYTRTLIANGL